MYARTAVDEKARQLLVKRVQAEVDGKTHVVAGPWTGEVGYELLYWIPLLRWLTREIPDLAERLSVISRGGVESWYADITSRYVEVFNLMSPEQIAAARALEDGGAKRRLRDRLPVGVKRSHKLDPKLVRMGAEQLGLDDYGVVTPGLAYKLGRTMRGDEQTEEAAFVPAPITPPLVEIPLELPERFVACRFYRGGGTPDHPGVAEKVRAIASALDEQLPVVNLDHGLRLDQHADYELDTSLRVPALAPQDNLRVLTAIIARATIYVGSYGGLSYLGPYLGVPTVTWLAQHANGPGAGEVHLQMIRRLFASPRFGDYVVIGPELQQQAPLLTAITGALTSSEPATSRSRP